MRLAALRASCVLCLCAKLTQHAPLLVCDLSSSQRVVYDVCVRVLSSVMEMLAHVHVLVNVQFRSTAVVA